MSILKFKRAIMPTNKILLFEYSENFSSHGKDLTLKLAYNKGQ